MSIDRETPIVPESPKPLTPFQEKVIALKKRAFESAQEFVKTIDPHLTVTTVENGDMEFRYIGDDGKVVPEIFWSDSIGKLADKSDGEIEIFFTRTLKERTREMLGAKMNIVGATKARRK